MQITVSVSTNYLSSFFKSPIQIFQSYQIGSANLVELPN